jgi:hydroxymethylglutaryl-CoA lyase
VDPTAEITVRDVGARDGLQSLSLSIPTADKVTLVRGLADAGVPRAEVGSFVGARAVPQMADSAAVLAGVADLALVKEALVVRAARVADAAAAGADAVVLVVAASDSFSRANVRSSTAEALDEAGRIVEAARAKGIDVVADIATAFGCAYEGPVETERIVAVAHHLRSLGVMEITLADTTGMAAPAEVPRAVDAVRAAVGDDVVIGLHFHNTRGLGLANVCAGLDAGVRLFDSSIGGLGGCPFSPGATGNVSSEDLVHLLTIMGLRTGIDLDRLIGVSSWLERTLGITLPSQVLRSGPRWLSKGVHE